MDFLAIVIGTLLALSLTLNGLLWVRVKQLTAEVDRVRGGVAITREELEQLRNRLERLRGATR
ncbi:MAG: hypothetical protein ACE5K4_08790 [Candidatus Hydrothermarchaeota archaeon]